MLCTETDLREKSSTCTITENIYTVNNHELLAVVCVVLVVVVFVHNVLAYTSSGSGGVEVILR